MSSKFKVYVHIRNAGGKWSLSEVYELLDDISVNEWLAKFKSTRAEISKKSSSRTLFGGGYKRHSMNWLACYSVKIIIVNTLNQNIAGCYQFRHPYLEKIDSGMW